MFSSQIQLRVRYGETDRMGYVYYANYAEYFEVARVEALRGIGINYKKVEDDGIILPVYTFNIKYLKPAFYDDLLTIKCVIKEMPTTRLTFYYETYNEANEKLNEGETTLVFFNTQTKRPTTAPDVFVDKIKQYFVTPD
jgi:acyl-CoA thioester hydrolase